MRAVIRLVQLVLVVAIGVVAWRVHARGAPGPFKTEFALSVFGERLDPDGTRHAVDLLKHPDGPTDSYQIAIAPSSALRVTIDELGATGARRVYPEESQSGVLSAGRTYALPKNEALFEHRARVKLRITATPESGGNVVPADAFGAPGLESLQMSDGRTFVTSARLFRAAEGGSVELSIQ